MPTTLPVGSLTVASIGLTAVVVGNAYYQKKQFYPSVVYITKSNPSLAAIYFLAFTVVILLGKLLKKVFFGQLRAAEFEQLLERSFYAVTETCLAFTVFRDDFSPKFVSLFTVLLFLKAFHYLTDSRVDFMERSPVITMLFHIRVTSLLLLLMMLDLLLINHSYLSTITHGASVQLVFGFEYAILLTVGFNIGIKYVCHSIDLRSENPWENKAVYLLYTELLVGFVKVVLYLIFLFIMIRIHTFPLFIIRPMYLTARSFKNALNDVAQSRRAIHNMNTLYPDASAEELATVDNVCIICREEMVTGAKKLPCGHIFHSSCLRSWFQRQQTCPTCRMNILQQPASVLNQQQQAAAAAGQPRPIYQQPQPNLDNQQQAGGARMNQPVVNPFPGLNLFAQNMLRPQFPFPLNQLPQQQQQQRSQDPAAPVAGQVAGASGGAASASANTNFPKSGFPFGTMPPFLPFMPFSFPAPPPPANFEGLTLDELRQMEGNERAHVEARIKTLKNIQVLLDAAAIQLSQYNSIVSFLEAQTSVANQAAEKVVDANTSKAPENSSQEPVSGAQGRSGLRKSSSNLSDSTPPVMTGEVPNNEDASVNDINAVTAISSPDNGATAVILKPDSVDEGSRSTPDFASGAPLATDSDPDDPNEIRRRRIEKFSSCDRDAPPSPSL